MRSGVNVQDSTAEEDLTAEDLVLSSQVLIPFPLVTDGVVGKAVNIGDLQQRFIP